MASSLFLIEEYSQQSGLVMLGKEFFKVRKWSSAPLMKCGITASVDGSVETQIKSQEFEDYAMPATEEDFHL